MWTVTLVEGGEEGHSCQHYIKNQIISYIFLSLFFLYYLFLIYSVVWCGVAYFL